MSLPRVLRLAVLFGIAVPMTSLARASGGWDIQYENVDYANLAEAVTPPPQRASRSIDGRAEFDVGRVKLRLAEDTWESVGISRRSVPYTGDRSGEIPFVTRYLLLRDEAGRFRAALIVGASWGVGSVRMTWLQNCRSQQDVHAVDNTRGNLNRRDCLRMTGPISPQRYIEITARDMLPELNARNVALPSAGYAVSHEIGLENATYLTVQAIFADDFKLRTDAGGRATIPSGVKPEAVAWGERLADAVRSCARSLSGVLMLPAVVAQPN